jgi:hypothetical protein
MPNPFKNPLSLFKSPLFHCLFLAGIYVSVQWFNQPPPEVTVSTQEIAAFEEELRKSFGGNQKIDRNKIISQLAEDKIIYNEAKKAGFDRLDTVITRLANVADFLQLVPKDSSLEQRYQAALAMKLDETDIVVRRQMITLFKTALKSSAPTHTPSEQDIQNRYDQNQAQYIQAARYAFSHVYLQQNKQNGNQNDRQQAEKLRALLVENYIPDANNIKPVMDKAIASGNVFYGGHYFNLQNQRQIARHFGQSFAEDIAEAPLRQWSQPIASAFGLHLIWLSESTPAKPKPLSEVRLSIERELSMQAQEQHYQQQLDRLTSKYKVLLESADGEYKRFDNGIAQQQEGAAQ